MQKAPEGGVGTIPSVEAGYLACLLNADTIRVQIKRGSRKTFLFLKVKTIYGKRKEIDLSVSLRAGSDNHEGEIIAP